MSNIYKENCIDYLEKGISVIPDRFKEKRPLISRWNEFCIRQPLENEVVEWVTKYSKSNISVCLGPASRLVALDLDTVDPTILSIILPLLPKSPVEKVGSKGFTRFFKYTGEETQVVKVGKDVVLELLSEGKKTTIPPSVHPNGKNYSWNGSSLLDIDIESLPTIPPFLMNTIQKKIANSELSVSPSMKIKTGRTLALGAKAAELISHRKDISAAVNTLIEFDKRHHDIPLFSDPKENKDITNEFVNALKFYVDYIKSINIKRQKKGKPLELPYCANNVTRSFNSQQKEEVYDLPEPSGLLKEIKEYILERSYVEQPVFATSAAISLIGVLARRTMIFQGTTPNTYMLNVGESGSGKNSCQESVKDLLIACGAEQLLGATAYPSEASITANIEAFPTRLDIIDEASSFLQTSSFGGASYQTGIGDTLCELFSCSNSKYLGKVLASLGGKKVGACNRPHISLLCSTTYKGVSDGLSRSTLEKGLFARFLVFFGDDNKRGKRVKNQKGINPEMLEKLKYIYNFENPLMENKNMKHNHRPYEITVTREADELLTKYHEIFDVRRITEGTTSVSKPILARLFQHMMKIVLISAIGRVEIGKVPKVSVEDVEFAYKLINFYFQSIEGFVEDNLSDSLRGNKINTVLRLIKQNEDGISLKDLTKLTKSLNLNERHELLTELITSGQIQSSGNNDNPIFKSLT